MPAVFAQKSPASETELKKQAEKLFEKESYVEATPMYSQLLSLYPRDAVYNYRYGVCLLLSGQDKPGAATYLGAAAKSKGMDPDVHFYLGRSYMFMDRFNDALASFNLFKSMGSTAKQEKLQPDTYIRNCENANTLRKDRKNVVVLNKSKVNRTVFFAAYDFTDAAGKLLTTPDRFLSPVDKEKLKNPVMFMTRDGETIYYASYGKKGDLGKDIYKLVKFPGGAWSEPIHLGSPVNTAGDEDYPYLDKDGRTLYFCSKNHNSIGGYDIFKSQYDFNSGKWSEPLNVGIPINTVDDDIFFMPSTKGETAVYSTAIDCESGKIEMRTIKLGDAAANIAVIGGRYLSADQVTRRDARITVMRSADNGIVTSVKTNHLGEYELVLPTGEDYTLIVEGGSYLPHAEIFSVPAGRSIPGMLQKVVMNKAGSMEEMTMSNYFSPSEVDSLVASTIIPTQVKKSEFDLKDTATSKMKAVTFDGKTIYVAAPSITSLKSAEEITMATENTDQPKETSEVSNETKEEPLAAKDEINNTTEEPNDDNAGEAKKAEPTVSDKASSSELVKMAFEDVQALREESKFLSENSNARRQEAGALDSLSKVQLKDANELLAAGDTEQSRDVFKASQENALESEQKRKEATSLEEDARAKEAEAETASRTASALMKSLKVDTNAVAYQSLKTKDLVEPSIQEPETNQDETANIVSTDSSAAEGNENATENVHAVNAKKLSAEADELLRESIETEELAKNETESSRKITLQKKSKELRKNSETKKSESAREQSLAERAKSGKDDAIVKAEEKAESEEVKDLAVISKLEPAETISGKVENADTASSPANKVNEKTDESKPGVQPAEVRDASDESVTRTAEDKSEKKDADPGVADNAPVTETNVSTLPVPGPPVVMPIDPVAQDHYDNYSQDLALSKKTEMQAKETEAKLLSNNVVEVRDSLVSKTSELNKLAITQWQDAQKDLALAKGIDPEIEEKVIHNARIRNSSKQDKTLAEKNKTGIDNVAENNKDSKLASGEKSEEGVSENREARVEVLDTTKAGYKEYVEVQQEILAKQTETVDLFVEGMKLNKQAAAIRSDEMKVRDQAAVAMNKKEKAKLEERADSLAMEADIIAGKSKASLDAAQKITGNVKTLTTKSDQLKEKLIVRAKEPANDNLALNPAKETVETESVPEKSEKGAEPDKQNKIERGEETPGEKSERISGTDSIASKQINSVEKSTGLESAEKVQAQQNKTENKSGDPSQINDPEKRNVISVTTEQGAEDSKAGKTTLDEIAYDKIEPVAGGDNPAGKNSKDKDALSGEINGTDAGQTKVEKDLAGKINAGQTKFETDLAGTVAETIASGNEVSDAFTFSMAKGDAYSSDNPIPMDPVLPAGLIFKVQIGAFRDKLPDNTFKNLQPLSGETSRPGWIRYCLGLFRTFEPANLLKKEVQTMGYPDAFVVAYYNGIRIPLYEAYALVSKADAASKKSYSTVSETEFSHLAKFEIRKTSFDSRPDEDTKAFYGTVENVPAGLVEYAVQVGVYKSSRTPAALSSLLPLNTEQMRTGLFRFTTGRFDNRASADSMKRIAVTAGVKDAFVVIYRGGKKVTQSEAVQIVREARKTAVPEAPVIVREEKVIPSQQSLQAGDIVFKIQLGAFRENVPLQAVTSFLSIADKGITQETDARGLHIFYAGQYQDYNSALAAREEIVSKGVKDAFIVGFVKGRRVAASEAIELLNSK